MVIVACSPVGNMILGPTALIRKVNVSLVSIFKSGKIVIATSFSSGSPTLKTSGVGGIVVKSRSSVAVLFCVHTLIKMMILTIILITKE